ncbi:hypothetical protein BYT27DRAFT_7182359 [Phlegmacium glaucopus]|nr:hypothetical protein BYT27DRAFT_7182359 [Phlegmacium glaucopus]
MPNHAQVRAHSMRRLEAAQHSESDENTLSVYGQHRDSHCIVTFASTSLSPTIYITYSNDAGDGPSLTF